MALSNQEELAQEYADLIWVVLDTVTKLIDKHTYQDSNVVLSREDRTALLRRTLQIVEERAGREASIATKATSNSAYVALMLLVYESIAPPRPTTSPPVPKPPQSPPTQQQPKK